MLRGMSYILYFELFLMHNVYRTLNTKGHQAQENSIRYDHPSHGSLLLEINIQLFVEGTPYHRFIYRFRSHCGLKDSVNSSRVPPTSLGILDTR